MPMDLTLPATLDGLAEGLARIDQHCADHDIDAGTVARLRIIVEELYSNTIKYGYGGECDRPIRLALAPGVPVSLVYEDAAAPFDPTRWHIETVLDLPPDERPVGQTGIALILGLATETTYTALPAGNRLVIQLS